MLWCLSSSVPQEPMLYPCSGSWGAGGLGWAGLVTWQGRGFQTKPSKREGRIVFQPPMCLGHIHS